jgi:hypothetical protein
MNGLSDDQRLCWQLPEHVKTSEIQKRKEAGRTPGSNGRPAGAVCVHSRHHLVATWDASKGLLTVKQNAEAPGIFRRGPSKRSYWVYTKIG